MSRRTAAVAAPPPPAVPGGAAPQDPHYSLFVVRWRRRPESESIEVEHVQSGHRTRVSSPARAIRWMADRMDAPAATEEAPFPGAPASPPPAAPPPAS